MEGIINTYRGPKSPDEALALFQEAKLPGGALLGIFNNLDGYPQAKAAREHVLRNPGIYGEKIERLAKEKSTGRPIGPKVINNKEDLLRMLWGCGLRARVAITIHERQARRLHTLLHQDMFLEMDRGTQIGLLSVAMTGEWCSVPRTLTATLSLPKEGLNDKVNALFGIVEKIELLSTFNERVKEYCAPTPLSKEVVAILAENTDLFYDRTLFLETCKERAFGTQQERVDELQENASMTDALMLFIGNISREEFLSFYIERFKAALA